MTSNQKPFYFVKNSNLLPQPLDTKPIGLPFVELQSVDSTNNYARQQIHAGLAQHGMAIFAHQQLSGKGQRGKDWISEKDANIILSIVIKQPPLLLTQQFMFSACVAVAAHDLCMKYAGTDTKIKWPNDLYWQDRKAGGILIESVVMSSESGAATWQWAIVGIGINVNQTVFPSELPNPVSLKQITGKDFITIVLAKELCSFVEKYFQQLIAEGFDQVFNKYNQYLYKRNEIAKLKKDNRVFEAIIKSVSRSGKLIVHPDSYRDIEEDPIDIGFDFGEIDWII